MRTALARALVSDQQIILLDEPTNHLDWLVDFNFLSFSPSHFSIFPYSHYYSHHYAHFPSTHFPIFPFSHIPIFPYFHFSFPFPFLSLSFFSSFEFSIFELQHQQLNYQHHRQRVVLPTEVHSKNNLHGNGAASTTITPQPPPPPFLVLFVSFFPSLLFSCLLSLVVVCAFSCDFMFVAGEYVVRTCLKCMVCVCMIDAISVWRVRAKPCGRCRRPALLWLERHLKTMTDIVLIVVSHDRTFLDNVATDIARLTNGTLQ
jgi:hypothetical protein